MSEITDKYTAIIKSMYHDINRLEHNMLVEFKEMEDAEFPACKSRLGQITGLVTEAGDTLRTAYYLCK